jgi:hypothetical protein
MSARQPLAMNCHLVSIGPSMLPPTLARLREASYEPHHPPEPPVARLEIHGASGWPFQ